MEYVELIYIDVGHGERGDPGAVNNELVEHQMNMTTAKALAQELTYYGYKVKLEEGNLEVDESAKAANRCGADLFISIHHNAGGGDRGEVIYSMNRDGSLKLANTVALGLKAAGQSEVKVFSKPNRFGNADYYGILRNSAMPAVIVEPAFIDNAMDRQLVDTIEEQERVGRLIAESIASVYGSKKKEEQRVVYKTIKDVPSWGKPVIQKLMDRKSLIGEGRGEINISQDMLRIFVVLEREGVLK